MKLKRFILLLGINLLMLGNALPILAQNECTRTAEEYRTEGIAQYQANDVAGAIASFICVTELDPEDAIAFNNLGYFYALAGDAENSLANFATAEALDPTYPLTYVNRGDVYLKLNRYEDALADFEKAFELNPDGISAFTYNEWGLAHYFLGEYEDAIPKLTSAIEIDPEYADALNSRGFTYIEVGEYISARRDFRRLLELAPDYTIAYAGLGDAQYALGLARPALDAYQIYMGLTDTPTERVPPRITELEGILEQPEVECTLDTDLDGYLGAGNQAFQRGNLDVAINLYSCAIQNFPDEAMGYNNRGFMHLQNGALNFALDDLSRALEIDPDFALALANRGQALYSLSDLEGALIDLKRSIRLDSSASNQAFATTGYVYADLGDFEAAIPYLVTSANRIGGNPDALSNLAWVFYQLERYDESFLAFEQLAVAINRDNFPPRIEELVVEVEALTGKTVISSKVACDMVVTGGTSGIARDHKLKGNEALGSGNYEEALEEYNCALEFNPFDSFAYNNQGLAYYQMGEMELALESYAKSLALNPWDAQTYSNRGYLYADMGELELAMVDFNIALSNDPEHLNALYGRADVYVKLEDYQSAKADLDTLFDLMNGDVPDVVSDLIAEVESNLGN